MLFKIQRHVNMIYLLITECRGAEFVLGADQLFERYIQCVVNWKQSFDVKIYEICCVKNYIYEVIKISDHIKFKDIKISKYNSDNVFLNKKIQYKLLQDEDYAYKTLYYCEWKPVIMGLVSHPRDWLFSGYRFHLENNVSGIFAKVLDHLHCIDPLYSIVDGMPIAEIGSLVEDKFCKVIGDKSL
ncbi:MAG: hypothetical protein COS89_09480 [Deltaproteobacteria bacterium CG07_land_8_20_14_0_80_38_7]|nr:MAG: hypothetical protein COS89_09480 [Deltaproteobacteria bacterium CG07_land_8_20_14_0_80_38_7]